jgi:hypothetical protein
MAGDAFTTRPVFFDETNFPLTELRATDFLLEPFRAVAVVLRVLLFEDFDLEVVDDFDLHALVVLTAMLNASVG